MVDDDNNGWWRWSGVMQFHNTATTAVSHNFKLYAHPPSPSIFSHFEIKWSHLTSTKPKYWEKNQMLPRLQRSQPMLLGQPDSKVLARLFGSWCFTKRKKIIQRCLSGSAVDLFWSQLLQKTVNCSLSEIWLQCSYSTLFKDFCNNTSILLQQHFSISATPFCIYCNTFHLHWGSTELLWSKINLKDP